MNTQILISLLTLTSLSTLALSSVAQETANLNRRELPAQAESFHCDTSQNPPITFVRKTIDEDNLESYPLIYWSEEYFTSAQALSLCQEVSQKLQTLQQEQQLTFLTLVSETVEEKVAVCFEAEKGSGCDRDQILFTIDTDQPPEKALYSVISDTFKQPILTRGDFPTRMTLFPFSWLF